MKMVEYESQRVSLWYFRLSMVLFILQKVARISFEQTVKAVLPWLWPLLATLALITYVPSLVLWLPGVIYGK